MHPFDFASKHVFVAGGTSGINLGISEAFAQAGAAVSVISRNPERVAQAGERLAAHGGPVCAQVADVRDFAGVSRALAQACERFGPIDVLVSGAAGNFLAEARSLSPNGFKAVVDIDLIGSFHVMRAAYDHLRKPGASIVNISAPQSYNPAPMQVHACAAKAGMDQIMRVLALEWGGDGIRVNSVVPGVIADTGGLEKLFTPAQIAQAPDRIPLRRLGRAQDIAQMVMFLSSPMGSYVTGALIPVDGGISLLGGRNHVPPLDAPAASMTA